jgi:hypothetical protein
MAQHAVRYTVVATFIIVTAWSTRLTVAEQQPPSARTPARVSVPLNIGGSMFRAGMPRQEAMPLIAECCSTSAVNPDSMFLVGKNGGSILGSIFFRNGRVSALSRNEKQFRDKDTSDFMVALYRSVLDHNTAVQSVNVTLSAYSEEITNAAQRHLLLTFANGRKSVHRDSGQNANNRSQCRRTATGERADTPPDSKSQPASNPVPSPSRLVWFRGRNCRVKARRPCRGPRDRRHSPERKLRN